jgi:predicted DNA-binding ribbon-helix-helix protein
MSAPRSFGTPQKRSVTIAGHETSISLEPMFWAALERAASDLSKPISALIADIDAARLETRPIPNLTSAIRQWLFLQLLKP